MRTFYTRVSPVSEVTLALALALELGSWLQDMASPHSRVPLPGLGVSPPLQGCSASLRSLRSQCFCTQGKPPQTLRVLGAPRGGAQGAGPGSHGCPDPVSPGGAPTGRGGGGGFGGRRPALPPGCPETPSVTRHRPVDPGGRAPHLCVLPHSGPLIGLRPPQPSRTAPCCLCLAPPASVSMSAAGPPEPRPSTGNWCRMAPHRRISEPLGERQTQSTGDRHSNQVTAQPRHTYALEVASGGGRAARCRQ